MKKSVLLIAFMLIASLTASAQKFALIDMEYILKNIPAYERANEQLNQISQKYQGEVEALGKEAQKLYQDYQTTASSLNEKQKSEKENAIIAKEKETNDLKRTYFGPEGEMYKLREKLIKPIEDQIYNAVKDVSEQNDYSVVVDRASATSIIYATPRIDISNEVLAKLGYSN